jgi:hypothetical protein
MKEGGITPLRGSDWSSFVSQLVPVIMTSWPDSLLEPSVEVVASKTAVLLGPYHGWDLSGLSAGIACPCTSSSWAGTDGADSPQWSGLTPWLGWYHNYN